MVARERRGNAPAIAALCCVAFGLLGTLIFPPIGLVIAVLGIACAVLGILLACFRRGEGLFFSLIALALCALPFLLVIGYLAVLFGR